MAGCILLLPQHLPTPSLHLHQSVASFFLNQSFSCFLNLFPPFHLWSALFTFSIHFMYHCLHQNIFLKSSQNMTTPPHTISPCLLICCFLHSQHVHQLHCFSLVTNFTPHIAFTIDFSALLKIATSFSLQHHVSFPYSIANLT